MTVDSWWEAATTAALLGTTRRPPPELPAELGVRARPDADDAERLLDAAAVGGVLRRAGMASSPVAQPEPAPEDPRPAAHGESVQLLELLLHQSPAGRDLRVPLIGEWLAAAAGAGVRLPHTLLPDVLDLATADARLRAPLAPVAGTRATWLAGHNEAWSWLLPAPAQTDLDWTLMTGSARAELLQSLRVTDPDGARDLIESTWSAEAAPDRKAFVEALHVGLSLADEPFLEAALDDRAKGVREAALAALDRLPGSNRARRMADRLRPLITVSKRLLGRSLTIELPPDADAAAQRDGLVKPVAGAGGRNLALMAATAPLSTWTDATGLSPSEVYALVTEEPVRAGIRRAAQLQRDATWALMLAGEHGHATQLPYVDPAARAQLGPRLAAAVRSAADAHQLLTHLPGPWDPTTSNAVVRMISERAGDAVLQAHATTLAERLHPDAVPHLRQLAGSDRPDRSAAAQVVQFLTLRHAIREAFA